MSKLQDKTFVQRSKLAVKSNSIVRQIVNNLTLRFHLEGEHNLLIPADTTDQVLSKLEIAELIDELEAVCYTYSNEDLEEANSILNEERRQPSEVRKSKPKRLPGFIYLIHAVGSNRYKIGRTARIESRLARLKAQAPYPMELIHHFWTDDSTGMEATLHTKFQSKRVHGEWFELSDEDIETIKIQK